MDELTPQEKEELHQHVRRHLNILDIIDKHFPGLGLGDRFRGQLFEAGMVPPRTRFRDAIREHPIAALIILSFWGLLIWMVIYILISL